MQIEMGGWHVNVFVGARVHNGPVLPKPYSSVQGKKYRVEHVHITFTLDEHGSWKVISYFNIELSGTVLKQDGTDSRNHAKGPASAEWHTDPEWGWLDSLVRELRPVGAPERACRERFEIVEED